MSVQDPLLLPQCKNLLRYPQGWNHQLIESNQLHLAAWIVSGRVFQQKEYQSKLQTLSQIADDKVQYLVTTRPGESGLAGMLGNRLIQFEVM